MEGEAEVKVGWRKKMRNIYLSSLFKFDGGIYGKLHFKKYTLQHFKMVFSNSLEILSF